MAEIGGCPNVGGIPIGCTMPGFPNKSMPFMNQLPGWLLFSAAVQTYGRAIHGAPEIHASLAEQRADLGGAGSRPMISVRIFDWCSSQWRRARISRSSTLQYSKARTWRSSRKWTWRKRLSSTGIPALRQDGRWNGRVLEHPQGALGPIARGSCSLSKALVATKRSPLPFATHRHTQRSDRTNSGLRYSPLQDESPKKAK
jgi:hypothetical protein